MTLARNLLVLLACLLAVAGCGGSHRPGTSAGPLGGSSTTGASPETIAAAFADAYVRFLDGGGVAAALPDATEAVRHLADQAGPVPASRRRGTLVLAQLRGPQVPGASYFVVARNQQAHTFFAQISLRQEHGRWVVVQLTPPDVVQALAPAGPPASAPPRTSAAPETAARRFLHGYLAGSTAPRPCTRSRTPRPACWST